MTRAIAFGTFSIIHPGHVHYLKKARETADELIVVVARDKTVEKVKGKSIVPEEQRRKVVEALKPVDKAVLGKKGSKYEVIRELEPDIIVLGPDQEKNLEKLEIELRTRNLNPKIIRISKAKGKFYSSSKLVEKILKQSLS